MIAASGLVFGYRAGQPVIDGMDARFAPGSISALVGRSGSGKSTLLYLLGLMLTARHGSLTLDGSETVGLRDAERAALRAEYMGFVFQDALLDPARSVLDNVMEGALYRSAHAPSTTRALRLLHQFGVAVDPRRKPGQISGGQAQRVGLCRAFIGEPRIIVADEPTGNLDVETAEVVWAALHERARQGATVILATHDQALAAQCDQVLTIGDGHAS